ncbi:HAD family hydrolase [Candidatus Agathobaculum pullicola]|uniref:HAD family hydrolase n=1 Tax=Candidatus Agathobaculum pullicola TaxID=2838426 RepID=UPI003F90E7D8
MIRAVIFDMDGLMFETERVAFQMLQTACAKRGLQFTIDMKRQMCGADFAVSAQIFADAFGAIDPAYTYDVCWSGVRKEMEKLFAEQGIPCKPGLRELLDFLSDRGIKTAVASGSARHVVQKYIEIADLGEYFPVIVGGGDFRQPKPSPESFLLAAERLTVSAPECLVLEDSGRGLEAAYRAGMCAIWVPDLDIPRQEILAKTDAVCETLADVIPWLKAQNSLS